MNEVLNNKISIITVCYNSEKTISKTIESVLNQSYDNIEYILIDGKSKDTTLDIIRSYQNQFSDKNISYKYISEPDLGIYDAMNKGVKLATGDWVGIINSDDWYELDALAKINGYISNNSECDIVCGAMRYIQEIHNKLYYIEWESKLGDPTLQFQICHPASFVRRTLYDKYFFDTSYKIAGDWDLFREFYLANYTFFIVKDILSNFMVGGISSVYSWNVEYEKYIVMNKSYPIYAKYKVAKAFIRFIKTKLLISIQSHKFRENRINKKFLKYYQPL